MYKAELIVETQDLEKNCHEKEIEKKYCELLKEEKPYVEDVQEFKELLNNQSISKSDKINILLYVINSNKVKYGI